MTPWSKMELRLTAAMMPAGMPTRIANSMAQVDSSIVAGHSVENSWITGACVTAEMPRSPWRTRSM